MDTVYGPRQARPAMHTIDLARYDSVLFFLGAGMSAESGVPTYRGRGGIWEQYRYEDYACQRAFERAPERVLDFHELRRATETITDEEVIRVRNQIRAGLLMSLESPSSRAGQLARQQILWGRPIPLQETVDRINRITAERVKLIARQVFDNANVSLAGIGPVNSVQVDENGKPRVQTPAAAAAAH